MTAAARWKQANEDYLAEALSWLGARFEQRMSRFPSPSAADPPSRETRTPARTAEKRWPRFRAGAPDHPTGAEPTIALPAATGSSAVDNQAAAVAAAAADMDPPPALVTIAERFGLTSFERDVLLLCAAMELEPQLPDWCAEAQGRGALAFPTFALAFELFDAASWEPMLPGRPLRYYDLVEVHQPPGTSLLRGALRGDERIVGHLKGMGAPDDRLAPLLMPLQSVIGRGATPTSQGLLVDRIVGELNRAADDEHLPVVQLLGADGPSKQLVAAESARRLGVELRRLPVDLLPADPGELERLARLWERESVLLPMALYLDAGDAQRSSDPRASPMLRFLARSGGLVFLDTREVLPSYGRPGLLIEVARPPVEEQAQAWRDALGATPGGMASRSEADDVAEALAGQFDIGIPTIRRIAEHADTAADDRTLRQRVWSAALAETRTGLDRLAQRIEPKATWDDIVLPPTQLRLLERIADQVVQRSLVYGSWGFARRTSRGLGINALFTGPSGTGKTMAAEVLANHLELNLYRIDLAAVVSKYIGETEKNLASMFDEAEAGGVVLFFDEADALFGKRTEIRDSHDRYANIEINYLLQRIETFSGLAILATNMRSALDEAFLRRLRFIVAFPYPSIAQRTLLWERVFPEETPTEALDIERLGKLNLTGGNVFTVAMNAAFLAARDDGPVQMRHVLEAARAEARKLEMPIDEREYAPPVEAKRP